MQELVIDATLYDETEVSLDTSKLILDSGAVDSAGVRECVAFIESEICLKTKDGKRVLQNLDSIDNLIYFVQRKSGA